MIALLTFLITFAAFSVSPDDIVRSVLEHYPLIESSLKKVESSEGEVTAAEGAFDHKIKFKTLLWRQRPYNNEYYETVLERQTPFAGAKVLAGHRQGAGEFNTYARDKDTSTAGQIFAGISLPLLRNLKTDESRTDLRVKKLLQIQAEQELRIKKLTTLHKALSTYYKWLLQTIKVNVARDLLDLALERRGMLTKTFRAGDTEKIKVTDNERQINKRQSTLIEAEIEQKRLSAALSLYYRGADGKPVVVESHRHPEEILLDKKTIGSTNSKNQNPQVKFLSVQREISIAEYDLGNQSRLPGLDVSVLGGRELSNRPNYGEHILELGVNFDFPLENRKADGKSVAYYYKKKAAELEMIYLEQELTQLTDFSVTAGQKSWEKWKITNTEFDNTKKVAVGERRRWRLGSSDLFVVNLREQDQADVDMRRWLALFDYHQYHLDSKLYSASLPID